MCVLDYFDHQYKDEEIIRILLDCIYQSTSNWALPDRPLPDALCQMRLYWGGKLKWILLLFINQISRTWFALALRNFTKSLETEFFLDCIFFCTILKPIRNDLLKKRILSKKVSTCEQTECCDFWNNQNLAVYNRYTCGAYCIMLRY